MVVPAAGHHRTGRKRGGSRRSRKFVAVVVNVVIIFVVIYHGDFGVGAWGGSCCLCGSGFPPVDGLHVQGVLVVLTYIHT